MFISTKLQEEDTSQEQFWWILNLVLWTPSVLVPSVNSSDPTTSFSAKQEQETIGQKDITLKVLNSLIQSSMSSERKLKVVIVYKGSKSLTLWEVVLVQEWEPCLSQRSEKNILIELWKPSRLSPHLKYLTQSLNLTMLLFQYISWSKMLMSVWLLTMKPYMIFASELLSSPPPLMEIWTTWFLLLCLELLAV